MGKDICTPFYQWFFNLQWHICVSIIFNSGTVSELYRELFLYILMNFYFVMYYIFLHTDL